MDRFTYPIVLTKEDDTFLVSFPDFPEAHTFGETEEEAKTRAVDALATIIDAYISDRQAIPLPSTAKRFSATLPLLMRAKVELYNAMRDQKVGKAELARRLDVHMPQVDRLLDVRHTSQLGQLESAFRALGKGIELTVTSEPVERRKRASAAKTLGPKRMARAVSAKSPRRRRIG
jgi:antitoxin HicB